MRDGEGFLEEGLHGVDDVPVIRFALLVVHDDDGAVRLRGDVRHRALALTRVLEAPDVVEEVRAHPERFRSRRRMICIDGDRHGASWDDLLQKRQQARLLLRWRQRRRARPRGFCADVDEVRAVRGHLAHVRKRRLGRVIAAAVGKGVRRDVEDAHDERFFADRQRLAVGECICMNGTRLDVLQMDRLAW